MKLHTTDGLICLKDNIGIEYVVCEIEYSLWENEDFEYRFRPVYSVIDLLDSSLFQGIPGIDLSKRKAEYVRKNIIPVFISERAPGPNREDLWELLNACNMQYLNQLEWLTKTDTHYVGDRLYVRETTAPYVKDISFDGLKRTADVQKRLLDYICAGRVFQYEEFEIDDSNRDVCYNLIYRLYCKESERLKKLQAEGVKKAKANGKYQGRKSIQIDELAFNDVANKYRNNKITADEAANKLGISVSTFYRRLKLL